MLDENQDNKQAVTYAFRIISQW